MESNDYDLAIDCYQKALTIEPHSIDILSNLGVALRRQDRLAEALEVFEKALAVDPDNPRLHQSRGNVLYELGRVKEAVAAYQQSLSLDPGALEVHESLNEVLWQQGMGEDHLASYSSALQMVPQSLPLRLQYASSLSRTGRFPEAESVLREAGKIFGRDAGILAGLGLVLANRGRIPDAIEHLEASIELAPENIRGRQDLARLLISTGQYQQALQHIDAAIALAPLDQSSIAYRGLCWRLLRDPRAALLNDYDRFVKSYRIPVPEGYRDIDEFNNALNHALDALHRSRIHPLDQTLRGGTQTHGNLFARRIKEVQEARNSIEHCIRRYIDEMDDDLDHPLLGRKSERFRFSASWSCRLKREGFHTNHVHPKGWISSSYYVALPAAVRESGNHEGWIKFGESNLGLGSLERIEKIVQPEEGLLVLFPSYMYHGTVPFAADEARTTIAFDVVPD